jgi:hypothetical protein
MMLQRRRPLLVAAALIGGCGQPVPEGMEITIIPANPNTLDALTAVVTTEPLGEGVTYTYAWTANGVAVPDITGPFVPADRTSRDEVWAVVATPTSADGKKVGDTQAGETLIVNAPPVAVRVSIEPTTPTSSDPLVAVAIGSDIDGDAISWTYTWYLNGVELQAGSADRLEIGPYVDGDVVDVVAVASDGQAESSPVRSSPIRSRNSPPILAASAIVPAHADPHGFTELTCAPGDVQDQDGDPLTYQYDWFVNGARLRLDVPSVSRLGRRGDEIGCQVRPFDGKAYGEWVVSAPVTLSNTPPAAPDVEVGPDEASQFDSITCDVLSEPRDWDGDLLTYTFTFSRDGAAWTGGTRTTVYPGDTVDERFTEIGQRWTCSAIASDGVAAGAAGTSREIEIINGWPAPITFNTCGRSGPTGPSQAECNARYRETALSGKVEVTAGIQAWRVPVTGDYYIEARGAQGGKDTNRGWGTPGTGAIVAGTFRLVRGDILEIAVGQQGSNETWGGGGGGGSWVMRDDRPLLIAGGGGGVGYYGCGQFVRACDGSLTGFATQGWVGTSTISGSCQGVKTSRLREGGLNGNGGSSGACQLGAGGGGIDTDGTRDTCSGTTTGGRNWANGVLGDAGTASGGFGGGGSAPWSGGGGGGFSGGDGSRGGAGGGGSFNAGTSPAARTGQTGHGQVVIDLLF